jgi:hypothetical protein
MYRLMLLFLAVLITLGMSFGTGQASTTVGDTLAERFRLSRIDVASGSGSVVKKGSILLLRADGVPANAIRFVRVNTKSPRFHVRDYARVEVGLDRQLTPMPGAMSLPSGRRLVVLDLKVDAARVRLFTHTLEPVPRPDGTAAYGCTLVFVFDPATLQQGEIGTVTSRIDQWLSLPSAG